MGEVRLERVLADAREIILQFTVVQQVALAHSSVWRNADDGRVLGRAPLRIGAMKQPSTQCLPHQGHDATIGATSDYPAT